MAFLHGRRRSESWRADLRRGRHSESQRGEQKAKANAPEHWVFLMLLQ